MTISQDMVGENKGGVHVILITTIDGVRVESDQLQLSIQDKLCDGKTYEKVIGQHPDITQGRILINDQHSLMNNSLISGDF